MIQLYVYFLIYTYTFLHIYFFFFLATLCGILVPQPGIEPVPPAVEAWSLNHWTTREVLVYFYIYMLGWPKRSFGFFRKMLHKMFCNILRKNPNDLRNILQKNPNDLFGQPDTFIYIYFLRFFSIIGYYKMLSVVPCATH